MKTSPEASPTTGHFRLGTPRPLGVGREVMVDFLPEPGVALVGWMRLELELGAEGDHRIPFQARLIAETNLGPSRGPGYEMAIGPMTSKKLELIFEIPEELTRLAMILPASDGNRVVNAEFRLSNRKQAFKLLLGRGAWHVVGRPGDLFRQGLGVWAHARKHGIRSLPIYIRGQLHKSSSWFLAALPTYPDWVATYDTLRPEDRARWLDYLLRLENRATISILVPVSHPEHPRLSGAVESMIRQVDPDWELCLAFDPAASPEADNAVRALASRDRRIKVIAARPGSDTVALLNAALSEARGTFVATMGPDDELAEDALCWLVVEASRYPDTRAIYTDEDEIDASGIRHSPRFKTAWNPDLFYSSDYVGRLMAYPLEALRSVGGFPSVADGDPEYATLLRLLEVGSPGAVRHVPRVLYHRRTLVQDGQTTSGASPTALQAHLDRTCAGARVIPGNGPGLRIAYPLPDPLPMVSVIIATRDREELLKTVVDGLFEETDYQPLEVLIIDNDSSQPKALAYLESIARDPRVRVLKSPGTFNYSALNNFGAANARGEILALLNNDLKMIEPGWLKELVSHAIRPDVGVVGAKLYYPDDHIQHAGVIVGQGRCAGHANARIPRGEGGYLDQAFHTQDFSAVTGACLITRAKVFGEAGGLDEVNLAVAFNDIDYCLKVRALGYRVLLTPYAEVYHLESASRGPEVSGPKALRLFREAEHMRTRWRDILGSDPFFNPNLSLMREQYKLGAPPRVQPPFEDQPTS